MSDVPVKLYGACVVAKVAGCPRAGHGQGVGRVEQGLRAEAPHRDVSHCGVQLADRAEGIVRAKPTTLCKNSWLPLCFILSHETPTSSLTTTSSTSKLGCPESLILDLITRQL